MTIDSLTIFSMRIIHICIYRFHFFPSENCDGESELSTLWDLGSPERKASGHACGGWSWLGQPPWVAPCHMLGSQTEPKGEKELSPSIYLTLLPDSACTGTSCHQAPVPSSSCRHDSPTMMECGLEPWARTNSFSLKLLLSKYFVTETGRGNDHSCMFVYLHSWGHNICTHACTSRFCLLSKYESNWFGNRSVNGCITRHVPEVTTHLWLLPLSNCFLVERCRWFSESIRLDWTSQSLLAIQP